MLASLKRTIKLINKDDFDVALFKVVSDEDVNKPKEKHMNLVVSCLKGDNKRVLALDAFTRITDNFLELKFSRWIQALKWCYVLHISIYSSCNLFVEAMCCNGLFGKVRQSQMQIQQEDLQKYIHTTLALNYFIYLQNRYENLQYLQNAMDDFDQKEESQKSLIINKIVLTLQLILKIEKELSLSIQKFPQYDLIRHIGYLLLRDFSFFYPILNQFVTERIDKLQQLDFNMAQRIYQNYIDLLRITRNMRALLQLKTIVTEKMPIEEVELIQDFVSFQISGEKNQEIELYFKGKEQSNPKKQNSLTNLPQGSFFDKKPSVSSKINETGKQVVQAAKLSMPDLGAYEQKVDGQNNSEKPKVNRLEMMFKQQQKMESQATEQKQLQQSPILNKQEVFEIVQFDEYLCDPQPEKIKATNFRERKPTRLQLQKRTKQEKEEKPELDMGDSTTQQSATTQQSFISEYSECRVMGGKRSMNSAKTQIYQAKAFYDSKQSPLCFLKSDILSRQCSQKDISSFANI